MATGQSMHTESLPCTSVFAEPGAPRVYFAPFDPVEHEDVDTTVIRLLDGTKAYVHAVIDNFSRRILAFRVSERFEVANTVAVLADAAGKAVTAREASDAPMLVVDGGVENFNRDVDELIENGVRHGWSRNARSARPSLSVISRWGWRWSGGEPWLSPAPRPPDRRADARIPRAAPEGERTGRPQRVWRRVSQPDRSTPARPRAEAGGGSRRIRAGAGA